MGTGNYPNIPNSFKDWRLENEMLRFSVKKLISWDGIIGYSQLFNVQDILNHIIIALLNFALHAQIRWRIHEQVGEVVGATAALVGFVCEQPSIRPNAKSSTAASYAAPQLGSLGA